MLLIFWILNNWWCFVMSVLWREWWYCPASQPLYSPVSKCAHQSRLHLLKHLCLLFTFYYKCYCSRHKKFYFQSHWTTINHINDFGLSLILESSCEVWFQICETVFLYLYSCTLIIFKLSPQWHLCHRVVKLSTIPTSLCFSSVRVQWGWCLVNSLQQTSHN